MDETIIITSKINIHNLPTNGNSKLIKVTYIIINSGHSVIITFEKVRLTRS